MTVFRLLPQSSSESLSKAIPTGHRRSAIVLIPAVTIRWQFHAAYGLARKYADAVFMAGSARPVYPGDGQGLDIDVSARHRRQGVSVRLAV